MKRAVIFASGAGTNADEIIRYFKKNDRLEIASVWSNRKNAGVLQVAQKNGIDTCIFSKDDLAQGVVTRQLTDMGVDLVILAGFLLKIPDSMLQAFPHSIVNIHPALLPKFGGKGMFGSHVHQAVIEAGEKESGITIHYIDGNYDEGQIIFQTKCQVLPYDNADSLAQRIRSLEHEWFPKIIDKIISEK